MENTAIFDKIIKESLHDKGILERQRPGWCEELCCGDDLQEEAEGQQQEDSDPGKSLVCSAALLWPVKLEPNEQEESSSWWGQRGCKISSGVALSIAYHK